MDLQRPLRRLKRRNWAPNAAAPAASDAMIWPKVLPDEASLLAVEPLMRASVKLSALGSRVLRTSLHMLGEVDISIIIICRYVFEAYRTRDSVSASTRQEFEVSSHRKESCWRTEFRIDVKICLRTCCTAYEASSIIAMSRSLRLLGL